MDTYTYLCKYILAYLAQRILVPTLNGYIIVVGDYIKQSGNCYCLKIEESYDQIRNYINYATEAMKKFLNLFLKTTHVFCQAFEV